VATGSRLGRAIASYIDQGRMVSDNLAFTVLQKRLAKDDCDGFILDGFPRTRAQAELLLDYTLKTHFNLRKVFIIELSREAIFERIGNRITCKNCGKIYNTATNKPKINGVCDVCGSKELLLRKDDSATDAIDRRINNFLENIGDIVSFYEKKGLIFVIDGLKNVDVINSDMIKSLEE